MSMLPEIFAAAPRPRPARFRPGWPLVLCAALGAALAPLTLARAETPTGLALLGRGVNFGNMLEAPREGEWGLRFADDFPQLAKQAGFTSVRLPVRWSAHAGAAAPFTLDREFLERVQHAVNKCLHHDLKVVLNVHHFDELYANPAGQRARFLAIWQQLAAAFEKADDRVFFELLNEPTDRLKAPEWNDLLAAALAEIRPRHPRRWIVVGPDEWNSVERVSELKLPAADRRLIVTVHYYLPFPFTHQGAAWIKPSPPVGTRWQGTPAEKAEIERHFAAVADWARKNDRPVYVGEFGSIGRADMASRVAWTRHVRETCERHQFAWAYWELGAYFGLLDPGPRKWRSELVEALLPPESKLP